MPQMHCNFFSYSLGHGVDLTITLPGVSPCDMDDPALLTHQMPEKFPVLYLLHGHGNDYLSWERFTCVSRYVEEYRIAVVSVSVGNTLYMDTIYGEKYYEFIGKEVPEFVKAYFPVTDRPEHTYIAGASMGGYGALVHAMKDTEQYRAVGAFSPATVWAKDLEEKVGHKFPEPMDLYQIIRDDVDAGKKLPDIFFCVGNNDFLIESVDRFEEYLNELKIDHRFDRVDGYEHEWRFWELELPEFLDWLPRTDSYAKMGKHKM